MTMRSRRVPSDGVDVGKLPEGTREAVSGQSSAEETLDLEKLDVTPGPGAPEPHRRLFRAFAGAILCITLIAGTVAVYSVRNTIGALIENIPESTERPFVAPSPVVSPENAQHAPLAPGHEMEGATWVNPAATDYVAWALGAYDLSLPEPHGIVLEEAATQHAQGWHDTILRDYGTEGIVVEASAQKGSWEQAVQCLWVEEWLDAEKDPQRRSEAGTTLIGSLEWPNLRFGDDPLDRGQAEYWKDAAEVFSRADRPGIEQFGSTHQCSVSLQHIER